MQAFKFSPEGKLLLTLGKKGITGGNESQDTFNGMNVTVLALQTIAFGPLGNVQLGVAQPVDAASTSQE